MRKTFDWLLSVETKAAEIYKRVSKNESLPEKHRQFIHELSEEEYGHKALLDELLKEWQTIPELEDEIIIDDLVAAQVEEELGLVDRSCDAKEISLTELFNALVSAECSEWNSIFLYAIKRLAKEGLRGERASSVIESHKSRMIAFINNSPELSEVAAGLESVEKIWQPRILIVDDLSPLRTLLARVLAKEGEVGVAEDGLAALELCREKHFDAIVSNIDMPKMTGIEFLDALVAEHGVKVKGSFIFMAGAVDQSSQNEISLRGVDILSKPFSLSEVRKVVSGLINKSYAVANFEVKAHAKNL